MAETIYDWLICIPHEVTITSQETSYNVVTTSLETFHHPNMYLIVA